MKFEPFIAKPGSKIKLKDFDPRYISGFEERDIKLSRDELKERSSELLKLGIKHLAEFQDKLYAQNT